MWRGSCLCLLFLGVIGLLASEMSFEEWVTPRGDLVTVFSPEQSRGTVLIVHSVFQDRETALPLARVLQRAGFTAVSVKLAPGLAFHQYLETLRALCDQFDSAGPLYAVGHSMGADLIATLAVDEPRIESLVAVGFPVDTEHLTCQVMLAAGAWDQLHSRKDLLTAAGPHPLVISPFSDHSQETLDPYLSREVAKRFGGEVIDFQLNRVLSEGLFILGLAGLLLTAVPPWTPRGKALAALVVILMLGLVNRSWPSPLLHPTMLALWLGIAAGNGTADHRALCVAVLRYGTLAASCVSLSWILNSYQNVLAQPSALIGLPVAVLSWPPVVLGRLSSALLSDGEASTGLGLIFSALLLFEVLMPGRLFGTLFGGLAAIREKLCRLHFKTGPRPGKAQLGMLIVLLFLAVLAWQNVKRAGYVLESSDLLGLLGKLLVLLVLPLLGLVVAIRARDH